MLQPLDYVSIPSCATRLQSLPSRVPLPDPTKETYDRPKDLTSPISPSFTILPSILLSSLPNTPVPPVKKRRRNEPDTPLLSCRDPLSVQITSVNFKRFIERVGPVFWLQDRIEEVVMWRRGWKLTTTWISAYAFLCYYPRLLFVVPHVILLGILLATYNHTPEIVQTTPSAESTVDWQGNIQAIQNLMGFYADAYTVVDPFLPHLTHKTPYTSHILTLLILSIPLSIFTVTLSYFPARLAWLLLGIAPLTLTNPSVRPLIVHIYSHYTNSPQLKNILTYRFTLQRLIDDNNLSDEVWRAPLKEVELFENERLGESWGKAYLREGERTAWTRGRDGSGIGEGSVSNLSFELDSGWKFVETEDWRIDYSATWAGGGDFQGWVYSDDSWLKSEGADVTRRRRWIRRVWYSKM